jgi:hypothetical protein
VASSVIIQPAYSYRVGGTVAFNSSNQFAIGLTCAASGVDRLGGWR